MTDKKEAGKKGAGKEEEEKMAEKPAEEKEKEDTPRAVIEENEKKEAKVKGDEGETAEKSQPKEGSDTEEHAKESKSKGEKAEVAEEGRRMKRRFPEEKEKEWVPKTNVGKCVMAGKYKNLLEILQKGELILEPEIVDFLVPDIMQEVIYIGGSPGKGGGIRRTATKMTARMHKSGRRFKLAAVSVVGNGDGIVGVGRAISNEHRTAIEKAVKNAKLNVIRVRRGCGSWECGCGGEHSIPFKTSGKSGSVQATLLPAPKGVGMVASKETRKILRLSGIHDVWVKTMGKTETRTNLIYAVFDALKNLNAGKGGL